VLYVHKLQIPLRINIYTTEGRLLGHYTTTNLCDNGIFIDGETADLMDTLRLLDASVCIAEIEIPHQKPIRTTVRPGMHAVSKNGDNKNLKVFLRFVRINCEYKQRYEGMLYSGMIASL
jgi:hypothetical protein